jgi:hypothetical protein
MSWYYSRKNYCPSLKFWYYSREVRMRREERRDELTLLVGWDVWDAGMQGDNEM